MVLGPNIVLGMAELRIVLLGRMRVPLDGWFDPSIVVDRLRLNNIGAAGLTEAALCVVLVVGTGFNIVVLLAAIILGARMVLVVAGARDVRTGQGVRDTNDALLATGIEDSTILELATLGGDTISCLTWILRSSDVDVCCKTGAEEGDTVDNGDEVLTDEDWTGAAVGRVVVVTEGAVDATTWTKP